MNGGVHGERAGIGHNRGPSLDPRWGWRRHCWARARQDLLGERIPVEVVRRRIARARELGLSYPQYASILLGTGRDIVAFLFTVHGLQVRLARTLTVPANVRQKLQTLDRCALVTLVPPGERPGAFGQEIAVAAGVPFEVNAPEPGDSATWREARTAIRAALDPLALPGSAVVMVGDRPVEAAWGAAGNVARYLASARYFDPAAGGP